MALLTAAGEDSVHGVGRMCPNPDSDFEISSVIDGKPVRVCGGKSWNNSKAVDDVCSTYHALHILYFDISLEPGLEIGSIKGFVIGDS